jgi:hypothetical protein
VKVPKNEYFVLNMGITLENDRTNPTDDTFETLVGSEMNLRTESGD